MSPAEAAPGDVIVLTVVSPPDALWGGSAFLENASGDRLFLVWTDPDRDLNTTVEMEEGRWPPGIGVRARGYRGSADVRIEVPDLPAGDYRITKTFVLDGDGPADARTIERVAPLSVG